MNALTDLRDGERRLTKRIASWNSPWARQVLPAVEEVAEHTKLWRQARPEGRRGGPGSHGPRGDHLQRWRQLRQPLGHRLDRLPATVQHQPTQVAVTPTARVLARYRREHLSHKRGQLAAELLGLPKFTPTRMPDTQTKINTSYRTGR
jgi:hypothetical protein